MGTVSSLMDWIARRSAPPCAPVAVNGFGFNVGPSFVAWQTVSEIWIDRGATDEVSLAFVAAGQCLSVSEKQSGFDALGTAMVAAFPATAQWRQVVTMAAGRTLLYRRG